MFIYIFATRSEAAPFIELSKARKLVRDDSVNGAIGEKPPLWQTMAGNVVTICGMGPKKAEKNTSTILSEFIKLPHTSGKTGSDIDRSENSPGRNCNDLTVINCGICGSLRKQYAVGDICVVTKVLNGDDVLKGQKGRAININENCFLKSCTGSLNKTILTTTSFGVFGGKPKEELAKVAHIVDMEGYSISKSCKDNQISIALIKVVSDFADSEGKQAIQNNIHRLSEKLAEILINTEQ